YIAGDLAEAGHEVMVIEQDPDLVARLRPTLDVQWFIADACEVSSLHEAGLETVDVVVAATGDDEDNLVISLLAKQEFAVPRVVPGDEVLVLVTPESEDEVKGLLVGAKAPTETA